MTRLATLLITIPQIMTGSSHSSSSTSAIKDEKVAEEYFVLADGRLTSDMYDLFSTVPLSLLIL